MDRAVTFYVLRHPVSKEVRYVGKTVQALKTRLVRHINNGKGHIGNWVKSITAIGLKPEIIQIGSCMETEDWQSMERLLINEFRAYGYRLCNICDGGIGSSGFRRNREQRRVIKERLMKIVYSKNTKTGEVRKFDSFKSASKYLKISESSISLSIKNGTLVKGNLFSIDGYNFNQSDGSKRYSRPVIAELSNGCIKYYKSSNSAGRELGLCPSFIRKVCRGEYKKYKGHKFRYHE